MRVFALMCFYDEPVERLYRAITSVKGVATDLIAFDGRYANYMPGSPISSPAYQYEEIESAAAEAGVSLTVHEPVQPWPNQMTKRTALLRTAEALGERWVDWCFPLDADYEVQAEPTLHTTLAATQATTLDYNFIGVRTGEEASWSLEELELRRQWLIPDRYVALFVRLQRDMRIEPPTHWLITGEDQHRNRRRLDQPDERLHDFRILHHTLDTPVERMHAKHAYLRAREAEGVDG